MGTLRHTPHRVSVIKPTVTTDPATGASRYDYASPVSTRDVDGLLQIRGGSIAVGEEGQIYNYDAMFYTLDTVIAPNDRVDVALPWLTDKFVVLATQPKARLQGEYDHNEVVLQKDGRK